MKDSNDEMKQQINGKELESIQKKMFHVIWEFCEDHIGGKIERDIDILNASKGVLLILLDVVGPVFCHIAVCSGADPLDVINNIVRTYKAAEKKRVVT